MDDRRLIVITGLSGAGRTTAANAFEDLGYFCVDNMPAALLPAFADLCRENSATLNRAALVIDIREREFFESVTANLAALQQVGRSLRVLFLEAGTDALVARYSESRRRHPMADAADDLRGAIEAEREKLGELRRQATAVVDTTHLTVHQLRDHLRDRYEADDADPAMHIQVVSFGYKYGVPLEADLVFDVRFLPNPHYDPALRPLTGVDAAVRTYVLDSKPCGEFLRLMRDLLAFVIPAYAQEGKSYLTIGIGCTGGRHRSVAVAVELARQLTEMLQRKVHVQQRDMERVAA